VIGYDARHNSDVFARDTAEVMTGAGFTAWVMPRALPTPLLAFAIRELGRVALLQERLQLGAGGRVGVVRRPGPSPLAEFVDVGVAHPPQASGHRRKFVEGSRGDPDELPEMATSDLVPLRSTAERPGGGRG
jgi:hypothetical protein